MVFLLTPAIKIQAAMGTNAVKHMEQNGEFRCPKEIEGAIRHGHQNHETQNGVWSEVGPAILAL